uniref:Uncharacterized protein n=1 Tax=Anguilla anguilla TaxID=7936 RepID=A0A0E9Q6Z9_ANGAN
MGQVLQSFHLHDSRIISEKCLHCIYPDEEMKTNGKHTQCTFRATEYITAI